MEIIKEEKIDEDTEFCNLFGSNQWNMIFSVYQLICSDMFAVFLIIKNNYLPLIIKGSFNYFFDRCNYCPKQIYINDRLFLNILKNCS